MTNCSHQVEETKLPVIDVTTGKATHYGRDVDFSTSIAYLREVDMDYNTVKTVSMSIGFKGIVEHNSTILDANIGQSDTVEPIKTRLKITIYNDPTTVIFANQTLYMPLNSVKYLFDISGWRFRAPTNSLQVIFKTSASTKDDSSCLKPTDFNQIGNHYELGTGSSLLLATFADNIIAIQYVYSNQCPLP
eukprot:gene16343-19440_t